MYEVRERQGLLMTTEGNVVHYGYIEKFIENLGDHFNIREIAFDRWGAIQMVQSQRSWLSTVQSAVETTMLPRSMTKGAFYSFDLCIFNLKKETILRGNSLNNLIFTLKYANI